MCPGSQLEGLPREQASENVLEKMGEIEKMQIFVTLMICFPRLSKQLSSLFTMEFVIEM